MECGLGRDTFRERFFGPYARAPVAEALQDAVAKMRQAGDPARLRGATEHLADAVKLVDVVTHAI